jgi:hypothetical protein
MNGQVRATILGPYTLNGTGVEKFRLASEVELGENTVKKV